MQKKILTLFWREAMHYPWRATIAIMNSAATVVTSSFIGPLIISQLLETMQSSSSVTLSASIPLIVAYFATQVYGEVVGWRITLFMTWTFETAAQRNLNNKIFNHLTHQSSDFHANTFGGSLVSQASKLTGAFERFWDTIIFQLVPSITSVVAAVAILSVVFWQYAIFILVLSIIFTITIFFGTRFMAKLNVEEAQASTAQTGKLADAMTNIMAIKSHGHENFELARYKKASEAWRNRSLATMWGFLKVSTGYSSLIVLLNTGAIIAAIIATEKTQLPIAVVYLSITYTFTVARQLWEMNSIMRNYNRVIGDAHDMTSILAQEASIVDADKSERVRFHRGGITFNDVTFSYDSKKHKPLFNKLNLRIKPGEKVGLVGLSGGGKTTITKLLLRFMDISGGTIAIDNQNIASVKQSELRRHIAYVPQEPILFHRSLHENIAYGSPDARREEIIAVAKMANAHEFISKLPEGYETLVGERGVKLSGGQRQRIVIARAMLKNAPIILLDEATSALDSESEVLIQSALWKLMEKRTAVVIAHRLSTIQKMDRILVLEKGEIVEEGNHKELLEKNGTYAKLWAHQSGGFLEE
jgi:ATP-binding cassette subfamily B protein